MYKLSSGDERDLTSREVQRTDELFEELLGELGSLRHRRLRLEPETEESLLLGVFPAAHRHQEHAELQAEVGRHLLLALLHLLVDDDPLVLPASHVEGGLPLHPSYPLPLHGETGGVSCLLLRSHHDSLWRQKT